MNGWNEKFPWLYSIAYQAEAFAQALTNNNDIYGTVTNSNNKKWTAGCDYEEKV